VINFTNAFLFVVDNISAALLNRMPALMSFIIGTVEIGVLHD